MPSIVGDSVFSSVADKLTTTLTQDAVVLRDVESHVEWIARELRLIQAFLERSERTTEHGIIDQWTEELKDVALDAEDIIGTFVIRSANSRRSWIFSMVDLYRVGKELKRIKNKIIDISQRRMNNDPINIDVVVEAPEEASGSIASPLVHLALQTLSSVLNGERYFLSSSLRETSQKNIAEKVRDDMVIMQKIMSNLRSTEQQQPSETEKVWLEEVEDVCDYTIRVIEDFTSREREEWGRIGWFKRISLLISLYATERKFIVEMTYAKTRAGGALRRGLTYGIGEEEQGVRDKIEPMAKVFSQSLKEMIVQRVIYLIFYLNIFLLRNILHLPPDLAVLSTVVFAVVVIARPIIADLWIYKPGKKLKNLKSNFSSDSVIFFMSFFVPIQLVLLLQLGSVLHAFISWITSIRTSMNKDMQSIKRELALMKALLFVHVRADNERQRIWVKQITAVAKQAENLFIEYEVKMRRCRQLGAFRKFFLQLNLPLQLTEEINDVLKKMHNIWERKIIYCIPNIEVGRALSLAQSTQGNYSESSFRYDDSDVGADSCSESHFHYDNSDFGGDSCSESNFHYDNSDLVGDNRIESNFRYDNFDAGEDPLPLLLAVVSSNRRPPIKRLMREEWQLIKALRKDVKKMGKLDDRSKIWVKEMRGISHEIELVNNEYANKLKDKSIRRYIWKYWTKYIINKKINQIRTEIQDASKRRETFGLFRLQTLAESTSVVPQLQTLDIINMDLPLHLRKCVFYLLLFPIEFGIPARRLVALWVAEGLVHQGMEGEPPEEVAESYLEELIDLDIVHVNKKKLNGKVNTCRLPNDLRELLLQRLDIAPTKKLVIRQVADHLDKNDICHNDIHGSNVTKSASLKTSYKDVLSFLSFDTREESKPGQDIGKFLTRCISLDCFLLLRVLDLEGVYKPQLPETIDKLSHLRYLGLRWTYLESLPSSVSRLLKLQTLDLKHTYINIPTSSIWKMEIRHLFLSEYRSKFLPLPKGSLPDLQTLSGLFIDEKTPVKGGLDRLVNIKKLGLACQSMSPETDAMKGQLEVVVDWIMKLEHLQSLRLKSRDEEGQPWNLNLKSLKDKENLTNVYLMGRLNISSILSEFPTSLTKLTLSHSELHDDPMQNLGVLLNLKSLCLLAGSYIGNTMTCSYGSFPKLLVLKLWKLEKLEEWSIEEKALPCLEKLEIRSCANLKLLPDGLQHVNSLNEFTLTVMPMEILRRVRNPDGEDWHKVSHIPKLNIDGGNEGGIQTWKCPPMDWVCLNSNGSVIGNSEASCGGLIRDEAGSVLGVFTANLGVTSVIAELWGVLHGLNYAWNMGLKRVRVDVVSPLALSLIQSSSSHESHPAEAVIQGIKDALNRGWTVEFCHIQPEANRAANILANMGHYQPLGVQEFNFIPYYLADVIQHDRAGVLYQRRGS